jgi:hypothetical protein
MDLVPSVEADAAARPNTLDQGRTKYTPSRIVETHAAYRPRGSEANRGCGRFGGRIFPAAPLRIHNHDEVFSSASVMLAACTAVLHRTK